MSLTQDEMAPKDPTTPRGAADEAQRRIESLERRARGMGLLAWLGFGLGTFAVMVLVLQRVGESGGPVTAQAFLLEDFRGRTRAALDLQGGEDEVRLQLNDIEGRTRLLINVAGTGYPQIQLRDERGRVRMGLGILGDGVPVLVLTGPDGLPRVTLRTEEDGEAGRLVVRPGRDGEDFIIPLSLDAR